MLSVVEVQIKINPLYEALSLNEFAVMIIRLDFY